MFKLNKEPNSWSPLTATSAKIENDYLDFRCQGSPQCNGELQWRDSKGSIIRKWSALSGCTSPPCRQAYYKLPSRIYHIFNIREKPINSAWCDLLNWCWAADLEPWQFYYNGELRGSFQIHPDGGVKGTQGCIGITRPNTSGLSENLFYFRLNYGKMKVIVE